MATTFGIRGIRSDYELGSMGVDWASFHCEGVRLVAGVLGIDPQYGEMRARELAGLVSDAMDAIERTGLGVDVDAPLVMRLELLAGICNHAGELGVIWWG